jgi:hypothetical protein
MLNEEHDMVHEKKDSQPGEPVHICCDCFDPEIDKLYTERPVHDVVGEENARRMQEGGPQIASAFSGFSNMRECECGAQTVVREDVTECFSCGRPFELAPTGSGDNPECGFVEEATCHEDTSTTEDKM